MKKINYYKKHLLYKYIIVIYALIMILMINPCNIIWVFKFWKMLKFIIIMAYYFNKNIINIGIVDNNKYVSFLNNL